jgi:electron transfer flavoprotein alpha/beta subunit
VTPRVEILSLYVPQKSKRTEIVSGGPAEAAAALVKKLREDARVI